MSVQVTLQPRLVPSAQRREISSPARERWVRRRKLGALKGGTCLPHSTDCRRAEAALNEWQVSS